MTEKNRKGMALTYTVEDNAYSTLGEWLVAKGFPKKTMKDIFQAGTITIDGIPATPKNSLVQGMTIRIRPVKEKIDHDPIPMVLAILYEDEDLIVIDKPVGVTMNSKGQVSLANGVAAYFEEQGIASKVRFINRLDRDTSGCVMVAKHGLAQHMYQQQMEDHRLEKWYRATVLGALESKEGILTLPLRRSDDGIHQEVHPEGVMTKTEYRVISYDDTQDVSVLDIRLWTGKTHQIRVSMAHIGHPLQYDTLYGGGDGLGQTFSLRASRLGFEHMRSGESIVIHGEVAQGDC